MEKNNKKYLVWKQSNHLHRQYHLGQWIIPPKKSHTIFPYYISPNTNMINKIKNQDIRSSLITQHNRTTITCDGTFYSTDLDDDISPITHLHNNTYQYQPNMSYKYQSSPIIHTFDQFHQTIPQYENMCIRNIEIINNELLCECITHHKTLIICTDGSYKKNLPVVQQSLQTNTKIYLLQDTTQTPGMNGFNSPTDPKLKHVFPHISLSRYIVNTFNIQLQHQFIIVTTEDW